MKIINKVEEINKVYNSYLQINDDFKSSINLTYDLGDENKIRRYVITDSICECLEKYIDSYLNNENKATYITGPYGKGKSYLLLVLSYIFSKKKNKSIFNDFLKRVKKHNISLAKKIERINEEKKIMLPVIVNNNASNSLINNFRIALKEALLRIGITDLSIQSSYSLAINQILLWQKDKEANEIFDICKDKLNIDVNLLKKELGNYSHKALDTFKDLYSCITRGANFNPLINDDISTLFEDTAIAIKNNGYSGIMVLYDEFGIFLENKNPGFVRDLNIIQGFAEKCNTSKIDSQLHIILIAHKDLLLYNNDKKYNDSFEKIVGRFKEYNFSRSFEENYSTLLSSYDIQDEMQFDKESKRHYGLIEKIKELPIFSEKEFEYIKKYFLPFNPLAIYSLVRVSKLVGQNERTLFTFISDNQMCSFLSFISHNESNLINIDYIYDYFQDSIYLSNQYNSLYNEVISLLQLCKNPIEFKIIKVIAIIKLINDDLIFRSTKENIVLSLGAETQKDNDEILDSINILLERNILKESVYDKTITFSSVFDTVILNEILKVENKFKNDTKIDSLLTEINTEKYVISNHYNFENKMTRYMKVIYLDILSFELIDDFYDLIKSNNADGIVVRIISETNITDNKLKELNKKYKDQPIIFQSCKERGFSNQFKDEVIRLKSCMYVLNHNSKLDDVKIKMLDLYKRELIADINKYLNKIYDFDNYDFDNLKFQNEINKKFSLCYPRTIKFNNEQVNRRNISKITEKSRNIVVDCILNNTNTNEKYNKTSQEATIFSTYSKVKEKDKNYCNLTNDIKEMFINSDNGIVECKEIINYCLSPKSVKYFGYGLRQGIIPIVLADIIVSLSIQDSKSLNTVVLYYKNREVSINAISINKLVLYPDYYYFELKKLNIERIKMIDDLIKLFNVKSSNNSFRDKIYDLVNEIKKHILSLPRTITNTSFDDNILELSDEAINFKNLFLKSDLNVYDVILNRLSEIFKNDSSNISRNIKKIKTEFIQSYEKFIKVMLNNIIKKFHKNATSLKSAFDLFISEYPNYREKIYDDLCRDMIKVLSNINYDDKDCINQLSSVVVYSTLDDFNKKKKDNLFTAIDMMIDSIKNSDISEKTITKKTELSNLGKTLFNNVLSVLSEYGSSVSNAEKALILNKALEEVKGL